MLHLVIKKNNNNKCLLRNNKLLLQTFLCWYYLLLRMFIRAWRPLYPSSRYYRSGVNVLSRTLESYSLFSAVIMLNTQ